MPMNIPRALGSAGNFAGEWLLNLADPNRKRYQQAAELARQKMLYDVQGELMKQSALNRATIDAANIKAEQDKRAKLLELAADPALPPVMREQAGLQGGLPAQAFPRFEGLGPRRIDPAGFVPQQTPLQQAQALDYLSQATTRRPRASVLGDFIDPNYRLGAPAAERALAGEPRAKNIYDFFPRGYTMTPGQATEAAGGVYHPPAGSVLTIEDLFNARIKAMGKETVTESPYPGLPDVVKRTSPLFGDPVLDMLWQQMQQQAGVQLPQSERRGTVLTPQEMDSLEKLLPRF
ncbi:MAG: hypothetical protein ACYTEQ_28460 [Planctomycetota bacterium]|jgi:hypothetical protein